VKNIEAGVPFFMFPRFVQLLIDHQLGDMSYHKDIYDNLFLTKKVFANMKRVDTGFSGVITALFDTMLVPAAEEVGQIQANVQSPTIRTEPSTSKHHKKHKSMKQQPQAPKVPSPEPLPEHRLPSPSNDLLPGGQDSMKLKELMDLCTHLSNKVLELKSEVIDIKSSSKESIEKLEGKVAKLEEENKIFKELHSVHSKADTIAPIVDKEKSFKQGRIIAEIDEDVEINLEEAQAKLYKIDLEHPEKVLSMQDVDKEEPAEVSVLRRRRGVIIQDPEETTSTVAMHSKVKSKDKRKGILIEEPKPLKGKAQFEQDEAFARQLEAELNADINWNAKEVNEEVTLPEKEVEVEAHKREGESLEKEVTTKQKMDEEAEDLKSHLQIVAMMMMMMMYTQNTMLKNFDKEDLETLWKLVKERFEKTEPKKYSDDYLLKALRIMFEQPDVEASVWRDRKDMHGYPLTHFTLEQMLNNVRLEVEELSELSLELLRLVRRQLIEG
nr:hypothetical protein [Tanacetum cinerariifolium]